MNIRTIVPKRRGPALGGLAALAVAVAAMLVDEAKRLAPGRIELLVNQDNARAIGFYRKHGFALVGDDVNPVSGRPVYRMRWPE